ncbi:MAG: hypothetical protein IJO94_06155 [Firmicutes bacterium]|nr:hypothetical protein [Bacillota bacterium]
MSSQVTNHKCPACTGPLHFVGASGKLECEYCGSAFDVAEIEALYAEKEAAAVEASAAAEAKEAEAAEEVHEVHEDSGWNMSATDDWGEDAGNMKAYSCPSCGAELICDSTTAATSCPYCDNPTIIPGQFSGVLKPDYVIPFKVSKEDAVKALKIYYKGKKFLPKAFSETNHVEDIKGIYVPFWLYDGVVQGNINFDCTRVETFTTSDERIVRTHHFREYRSGFVPFEKIPADASTKMPDDHMDSIEPFDYSEMKPFSTAYLPGYLADKYDVSADENANRAYERAKQSLRDEMTSDVSKRGYATNIPMHEDIYLQQGNVSYALLPVYMLTTKWNGQQFLFAMNGQTGKFIGDLPISKSKFFGWFAGISVPLMILFAVISMFL